MTLLKFNKSELVNLSYSLKREVLGSNKTGAYCNTSIVDCNTRRYHGLLAVTLDRFGGDKFILLSSVDETLVIGGKRFNLGIHCYGDIYEPRGHKYVVDFVANPVPQLTYKVGEALFRKSLMLAQDKDQVLIKYELLNSPAPVSLHITPFLAFRNRHELTHRNQEANSEGIDIENGVAYKMYSLFPDLNMQLSDPSAVFVKTPNWNMGITYSDEYRRGFDCREDLFVPGHFEMALEPGKPVVFSASLFRENPSEFTEKFDAGLNRKGREEGFAGQLKRCADRLVTVHNGRRKINAGFSWLYTGLLRETLYSLAGLTLYGLNDPFQYEDILDNLIADEQERLFHRTTQVEAPLYLAKSLQDYISYGADAREVWLKYGATMRGILESYLPERRKEVSIQPNGLLWAQMYGVALSWMNAYVEGRPVTERAGFQVETNALWYNAICFAIEMEEKYGKPSSGFIDTWAPVRDLVKANFQNVFWNPERSCLADYVDNGGQNRDIRPNQIYAISLRYSPIDEELHPAVYRVIVSELLTSRGIRTLSPRDEKYKGVYEGTQIERDLAYHQGCSHPFLLEPFVEVGFRLKGAAFYKRAEWLTEGFYDDLGKHGVGAYSELYDGDPPHEPHGAISSALSTAALLSVLRMMEINKEAQQ